MIVPILLAGLGGLTLLALSRRDRIGLPHVALPPRGLTSPVARQHLHLYKGGELSTIAVEAAKSQWREKLDGAASAGAGLRPGLQFVVQVRALAELGGEGAARVLERELGRNLSADPVEQSWYWIDLAQGLRELADVKSLPGLMRHVDKALELPLGHLYAAELVGFPAFQDYLSEPLTNEGQAALRVLHAALAGIRHGYLSVALYTEAQLGEAIHTLSESCPDCVDPLVARIFLECLRLLRRTDHLLQILREDPSKAQAFRWQSAYLRSAEPVVREYLHEIELDLGRNLPKTKGQDQVDLLRAILDFHTDTGERLAQQLLRGEIADRALAAQSLQYAKSPRAGAVLLQSARAILNPPRGFWFSAKSLLESGEAKIAENMAVIRSLRAHPSVEAEALLLQLAHTDSAYRAPAISSLCWWEPIHRKPVVEMLREGLQDPLAQNACLCALARLGDVASLGQLQQRLSSANPDVIHPTIDLLMDEGVTFLWPDLDQLTEHDDASIASHAWEILERMRENFLGPLG